MTSKATAFSFPAAAEPFLLPGGPTGCLLLHGLSATPHEMRFLGDHLHAHGHRVSGVRLAGHGTSVDDFERSDWQDWYASAVDGLTALQQHASRIVIVGLSMGALLAAKLAAERPAAVQGVVLLAPALLISGRSAKWVARLLPVISPLLGPRFSRLTKGPRDIADPQAREESPCYPQLPLRSIRELVLLQHSVRRQLSQVRQPILIIHSSQDHTCPVENVGILERELAGPVQSLLLHDSYHVISIDVEKERVARAVATFIEDTVATQARDSAASQNG